MGTLNDLLQVFSSGHLTASTILLYSLLSLATWYLVSVYLQYRRLRHIPGPFLNSITPLVCTYHSIKCDMSAYIYNLTVKYGPLVRITPNTVVNVDADTFRRICSYKAGYTKGLWFEFSRWDLDSYSCIAMRDNETRKERKNKLSPAVCNPPPPSLFPWSGFEFY